MREKDGMRPQIGESLLPGRSARTRRRGDPAETEQIVVVRFKKKTNWRWMDTKQNRKERSMESLSVSKVPFLAIAGSFCLSFSHIEGYLQNE